MDDLFIQKCNQLELEKEELEYYKLKYKRKQEKLKQEKRSDQAKLQQLSIKLTPEETEESFTHSETELCGDALILSPKSMSSPSRDSTLHAVLQEELQELEKEKATLNALLEQLEIEKSKHKRDKSKLLVQKSILKGRTSSETSKHPTLAPFGRKTQSEDKCSLQNHDQISQQLAAKEKIIQESLENLQNEYEKFENQKKEFTDYKLKVQNFTR